MTKPRPCGCKGCRTCLICETQYGAGTIKLNLTLNKQNSYVYCPLCNKAFKGWDIDILKEHPNHSGDSIAYPGVYIMLDFLNEDEEQDLMKGIDEMPWDISQSGRSKQNFGPKTNFKKRKIVSGGFEGFPRFTQFIQERFNKIDLLKGYETIEQCSLEYDPIRGASIDPHIDDCWIWGERIVTVNCLSDSILTMTPYRGEIKKYNLQDAKSYVPIVNVDGTISNFDSAATNAYDISKPSELPDVIIRIPMPRYVIYIFIRFLISDFFLIENFV